MSYFKYNNIYEENRKKTIASSVVEELPPIMENWDNDNAGTYNPKEQSEKKIVLRCLSHASKAVKRKFRKMERLRILKLLECQLPFINDLKQLSLNDDSIWEEISHICKLTIHDRQILDEAILKEFTRMKISHPSST